MKSVVITGGHHNSALIVAQEFVKEGVQVIWYGQPRASRGDANDSAEYLEVKASNLPFYPLHAGKINSPPTFFEIINIPLGFIRALLLLRRDRPDAVLSFGGYLGLTTALPARLLGIPVYLHEQTLVMGLANRLTSSIARRIFLTWQKTTPFPARAQLVGLPLRLSLFNCPRTRIFDNSLPTILIMGGKRGSHVINQLILANLTTLLTYYNLIHQTGTNSATKDLEGALSAQNTLPHHLSTRYRPLGYIGEKELGIMLASADLYIGRSGAHISYELLCSSLRALLIPFPHTTGGEQLKQAHYLATLNRAVVLTQKELSFPALEQAIKAALALPTLTPMALPHDASTKIVTSIINDLTIPNS